MSETLKLEGNKCLQSIENMINKINRGPKKGENYPRSSRGNVQGSREGSSFHSGSKQASNKQLSQKDLKGNKSQLQSRHSINSSLLDFRYSSSTINHQANIKGQDGISENPCDYLKFNKNQPDAENSEMKDALGRESKLVKQDLKGDERVFSLTQSREHFEQLLKEELNEEGGRIPSQAWSQSKIEKRSRFVDQQLLQKLSQKVRNLDQENSLLKLQNQQLKSQFDVCYSELQAMEQYDGEMQRYIVELEEIIKNFRENPGVYKTLTTHGIETSIPTQESEDENDTHQKTVLSTIDSGFNRKRTNQFKVEAQRICETNISKVGVSQDEQNAPESKKLSSNTETHSSIFSLMESKDRFALTKLHIKLERIEAERQQDVKDRDQLIEELWSEVKKYRKLEKHGFQANQMQSQVKDKLPKANNSNILIDGYSSARSRLAQQYDKDAKSKPCRFGIGDSAGPSIYNQLSISPSKRSNDRSALDVRIEDEHINIGEEIPFNSIQRKSIQEFQNDYRQRSVDRITIDTEGILSEIFLDHKVQNPAQLTMRTAEYLSPGKDEQRWKNKLQRKFVDLGKTSNSQVSELNNSVVTIDKDVFGGKPCHKQSKRVWMKQVYGMPQTRNPRVTSTETTCNHLDVSSKILEQTKNKVQKRASENRMSNQLRTKGGRLNMGKLKTLTSNFSQKLLPCSTDIENPFLNDSRQMDTCDRTISRLAQAIHSFFLQYPNFVDS